MPDGIVGVVKRRWSYEEQVRRILTRDLARLATGRPPLRILDLGCGTTSLLAGFHDHPARAACRLIGLDAHAPTIAWCRAHGFHDEYILADARDYARLPDVDVIVATDLVEHFDKPDALQLIAQLEGKASIAVLLFTPNGFVDNPLPAGNPYMAHKCGFTADEFERLGYSCTGLGGPKGMRGVHSLPRRPKLVTLPVLLVLSRVMYRMPRQSFHLLARKAIGVGSPRATD